MKLEVGSAAVIFTLGGLATLNPLATVGSAIFGTASGLVTLPIYWLSRKICQVQDHHTADNASRLSLVRRVISLALTWLALAAISLPLSGGFIGPHLSFQASLAISACVVPAVDHLVGRKFLIDSLIF